MYCGGGCGGGGGGGVLVFFFFFFNDTATTEIYTLSLHDALPISYVATGNLSVAGGLALVSSATGFVTYFLHERLWQRVRWGRDDRKSTRLNSSH